MLVFSFPFIQSGASAHAKAVPTVEVSTTVDPVLETLSCVLSFVSIVILNPILEQY